MRSSERRRRPRLNRLMIIAAGLFLAGGDAQGQDNSSQSADTDIMLLVRSDDMGVTHAVNLACLATVTSGIARSIEVLVPAPWFIEAAEMLQQHPEIDVGVHLDLTSEWSRMKWGPVSQGVPSLVDANGHFFPVTRQRQGWPPGTSFMDSGWKIGEVERELRAQIETALRHLPNVTHLSAHMGTATSTPELRTLVDHLATEYKLPIRIPNLTRAGRFGSKDATPEERVEAMLKLIDGLKPGVWLLIEHPGLDTPEMRAIRHDGYENVASDRVAVTHVFTNERVMDAIEKRGIKLVSYADILEMKPAARPK